MAAKNVTRFFNPTAPGAASLARLRESGVAFNLRGLDDMIEYPAPIEHIVLDAQGTAGDGSTADSYEWAPPYPIELVKVQAACLTAAGATGTAKLQKKPSGGAYADVTDAAVNIKTGTVVFASGAIVDTAGADLVAVGDTLKAVFTSGAGGTLTGGKCIVFFRRQTAGQT